MKRRRHWRSERASFYDVDEQRKKRYNEARAAYAAHPAAVAHRCMDDLDRSYLGVFQPNWQEFGQLLDAASNDQFLALELVQNVHSPKIRVDFERELSRRLHNHVASTMSLVAHVRRIVKRLPSSTKAEFDSRTKILARNPELKFMQDFRNYTLHDSLPFIGHTLRIGHHDLNDGTFESEVELSCEDLLVSTCWTTDSRAFLKTFGDALPLRTVVQRHGQLIRDHHVWLAREIREIVNSALSELNELRLAITCAQFDVDRATGEAFMEERAAREAIAPRPRPTPPADDEAPGP